MPPLDAIPAPYCLYAIHGPAFVASRGGNFWEPEDALGSRVLSAPGGLLTIRCDTEDDAAQVRQWLDALGLVPGVDFGIGSHGHLQLPCEGIVFKDGVRGHVQASGHGDWEPPPMPDHVRARHDAASERAQAIQYEFFRAVAAEMGVDRLRLESIDRNPKASERNRALAFALRSNGEGRG